MSGADPSRIALVLGKGNADTPGPSNERVATGYFLRPDLVLTARHVADQPGSTFRVRAEVGGSGAELWSDAKPVWTGTHDIDAMLLRTDKSFGEWEVPALAVSVGSGQWRSWGFARAAVDDEGRKALPIYGTFGLSGGQGFPELALTTEQNMAPNWENYWKGISGAPVFTESPGGSELIGIVTDANAAMSNGLAGLPVARLLDDISFRSAIHPSFLGQLPRPPWCLVLTAESSQSDLVGQVGDVLTRFRSEERHFRDLYAEPIEVPVLKAIGSVEHWAATVAALAQADYVIADVTSFEPAAMLLLGVRSVLRRGVTVSVTSGDLPSDSLAVPFNVQETKVLRYQADDFHDDLHGAMAEGATSVARDSNYLDLPAYHAVRAPRPESWAEQDARCLLVLCPFGDSYSTFCRKYLLPIIRSYTGNMMPLRMLDLKSPRLVGQALYEQIRWSRRCLVDWTNWRSNVFFEFGVRLAASGDDPLCIIAQSDTTQIHHETEPAPGELKQHAMLRTLLNPVEYDAAQPRDALRGPIESWSSGRSAGDGGALSDDALPPVATFQTARANFRWERDPMLTPPHIEQRAAAERILGKDQERQPERLVLFADNEQFDEQLQSAVRENWIASWLYLQHLVTAHDTDSADLKTQRIRVGRLADHALSASSDPRHIKLRKEIHEFLAQQRSRRRTRGGESGND